MRFRFLVPVLAAAAISAFSACGSRTNLVCESTLSLSRTTPNLYFVLDHSRSMLENGKWDSVRASLGGLVTRLGDRVSFGAALYPDPQQGGCATGVEVMSVRPGSDATAQTLASVTAAAPNGGTPTAATLSALVPGLKNILGHTFLILATDGGPNCNGDLTCSIDRCTANIDNVSSGCVPNTPPNCCTDFNNGGLDCLDDTGTVAAVSAVRAAGIPTFVIGVPGSQGYAQVLESAAVAGGTARSTSPLYYRVDSSDAEALTGALSQVIDQVAAACFLKVSMSVAANELIVHVGTVSVPLDAANGFTLEGSSATGQLLALHGAACDHAVAGDTITANVLRECPVR